MRYPVKFSPVRRWRTPATVVAALVSLLLWASLAGLLFSFPLAYWIVRKVSPGWRASAIGLFVTLMFLSVLVRTYALELTFGAAGPLRPLLVSLGVSTNGRTYIIPIPPGNGLPDLPVIDEAGPSGMRSIPQMFVAPGPDPGTYAYTKSEFKGNLFRIPLH